MRVWTTPEALLADLRRQWDRSTVLAEVAGATSIFPYRCRLSRPTTAELLDRFDEVRAWIRSLQSAEGFRIVSASTAHRTVGRNDIPTQVWVDDIDTACRLLGTTTELAAMRALVDETTDSVPALVPWLAAHPIEAITAREVWSRLLDVVKWMLDYPRPGIYVRQVDLVGVHTKLIETNRTLLGSLLDEVLPSTAIDAAFSAASSFAQRYGFAVPPATVTMRALDPSLSLFAGSSDGPVTITVEDFGRVQGVAKVFVTENYLNFLAFPLVPGAIVVFGQGYDVGKIAAAPWIANVAVHYWGDIDTHGFAILNLLRSQLSHVVSMLMDRATLLAHEPQWGTEQMPVSRDLPHLTAAERDLYDDIRDHRIRRNLRFEQELTQYNLLQQAVARS